MVVEDLIYSDLLIYNNWKETRLIIGNINFKINYISTTKDKNRAGCGGDNPNSYSLTLTYRQLDKKRVFFKINCNNLISYYMKRRWNKIVSSYIITIKFRSHDNLNSLFFSHVDRSKRFQFLTHVFFISECLGDYRANILPQLVCTLVIFQQHTTT